MTIIDDIFGAALGLFALVLFLGIVLIISRVKD